MTQNLKAAVDELAAEIGNDQRKQNRVISKLMPPDADSLHNQSLSIYNSTTTKYPGYLSQDAAAAYKADAGAGTQVSYLINDANFILETPTPSTGINAGDKGQLDLYINGALKDTFDLEATWQAAYEESSQPWTPANSPLGKITVVSVGLYEDFWQKVVARLNILPADLRKGYNTLTLIHTGIGTDQVSQDFEVFYDTSANQPTVSVPTLQIHSNIAPKWLSGIKHLGSGDVVKISLTGNNLVDNSYVADPVTLSGLIGAPITVVVPNDSAVSGLSNPPTVGQTMTLTDKLVALTVANQCSIDAKVMATPKDPFVTGTPSQSVSKNLLINTFGVRSTATAEYYDDEAYREPLTLDVESKNSALTGNWDSTAPLGANDAQVGIISENENGLMYGDIDYRIGYLPAQTANYAGRSGDKIHQRSFSSGSTAKSSIQLNLGTVTGTLGQLGTGDINVLIKLPGQTKWMDALRPYGGNAAALAASDGAGCMASVAGGVINATFGTFSNFGSNYRCRVRIIKRTSTAKHTQCVTNW